MKDEILEYIRKHVTEWPEAATTVRLDRDGEICFIDGCRDDIRPLEKFQGEYIARNGSKNAGHHYTREQWQSEINLETLDKPFGKLDRKTQLRLVEHVLDGGSVEYYDNPDKEWIEKTFYSESVQFFNVTKYRAKPSRKDEIERQIKALQDELDKLS